MCTSTLVVDTVYVVTTSTIAERVQRGAALLDTQFPGWVDSVDLSTLNLENPCDCILGQRFGDFDIGARQTGLSVETSSVPMGQSSRSRLEEHGFLANYDAEIFKSGPLFAQWDEMDRVEAEYVSLTREWAKLITDRRAAAQLAPVLATV